MVEVLFEFVRTWLLRAKLLWIKMTGRFSKKSVTSTLAGQERVSIRMFDELLKAGNANYHSRLSSDWHRPSITPEGWRVNSDAMKIDLSSLNLQDAETVADAIIDGCIPEHPMNTFFPRRDRLCS